MEEEVPWFGGCFLQQELGLLQIHSKVNADVYQNLLRQHSVPSLRSSPNQPAIFSRTLSHCFLSHSKTGNAVPWTWKHWNNEMARLKISGKSLVAKLWLRNSLQSPNCGKSGRRLDQDHTSTVWETSDVLWPQMLKSFKARALHFLLIFDYSNRQKLYL